MAISSGKNNLATFIVFIGFVFFILYIQINGDCGGNYMFFCKYKKTHVSGKIQKIHLDNDGKYLILTIVDTNIKLKTNFYSVSKEHRLHIGDVVKKFPDQNTLFIYRNDSLIYEHHEVCDCE